METFHFTLKRIETACRLFGCRRRREETLTLVGEMASDTVVTKYLPSCTRLRVRSSTPSRLLKSPLAVPLGRLGLACLLAGGPITAPGADLAAPVHHVDGSFVREWLVLGPSPSKELSIDFLAEAGGEANVRPKEGDAVMMADGTRLTWTRLRSTNDWVNSEPAVGFSGLSVSYAYCELQSEQACETDVRFGYDGPSLLWLNGNSVRPSFPRLGRSTDLAPVWPIKLGAGRNTCLLKFQFELEARHVIFQPLPPSRANLELLVTDSARQGVSGALVQFYDRGEVVARLKTDETGKAVACLYPLSETYDLRVTAGELGAWLFDVSTPPGERRELEVALTRAISISGKVMAMDGSPQTALVVDAIRVRDPSSDPGGAAPSRRLDFTDEQQPSSAENGRIRSLLPMPGFSATALTELNGTFQFVNLRPGQYRLRCHGPDEFVDPEASQGTDASGSPVVAVQSGRPNEGIRFMVPDAKKGVWKNYPITQGLREVHPTNVHRTPDGLLWIGTDESFLYAYDGVEFKMMASAPEIPANQIHALEHGADGTLWIGTAGGVSRHVGGRTQRLSFGEGLAQQNVNDILSDPDGTVWFATGAGLCQYDGRNLVTLARPAGLPGEKIYALVRARDGALWMGTSQGLVRFDGADFTRLRPFDGFSAHDVRRFHEARDGAIWFADTLEGGAYRYDGKTFSRLGLENGLLSDVIYDIAETSDGALWFATGRGLSKFNGTTVVNYLEEDGLSNRWVRDIFVDSDDVLWCANGWGVSRFDPKGFIRFTHRDGLGNSEGNAPEVLAIEPEPDGSVWIGTGWAGVFRSDGKKLRSVTSSSPKPYVRQIHRAADGTLWFGTDSGIMKQERGQMIRVLERNWVIALSSDDQGNLWYGHGWNGGGLSRYNPRTGDETVFGKAQGLPDDQVWALEPSLDGGLWVGTSAGLARYRGGKIEDFRERLGIPTGAVFSIRRDADETLWINSHQGLHRWDGSKCVSITATNGLPDQHVWCSARTIDGKIWIGTDSSGLLGYDGKAVTVLDKRDGMSGNRVFTVKTNADDSLWVGFLDGGLTRYQPTKTRPSVRVRGVLLDDQTLTNFSKFPDITTGRRVTIQYQEIDQKTHPEKRQFWYRLANRSGETVFAAVTKDRRFDWTPQKAGAYSFEVQAIDRDLNYSEPARFSFRVGVPWYANAWITLPGGATFGGLMIWSFIARALYLRKSREAERLQERARIARDLHDHLGAGLTHLAMVGELVRQHADQSGDVQMLATRLSESARELTRAMGEVIWATDPDKDTLRSFASFVSNYAERFFAGSALRLRFEFPAEIPALTLTAELRRSLFMVAKEAMSNVAKHGQASELRVKLELCDHELRLSFADDGQGFSRTQVAEESHGLVNMEKRLHDLGGQLQIESAPGQGTRIHARLPLPKK